MRTLTQLLFNILALNNFFYYLFSSYKSDISEEEYSYDWSSEDWGEGEEDAVGELIGRFSKEDATYSERLAQRKKPRKTRSRTPSRCRFRSDLAFCDCYVRNLFCSFSNSSILFILFHYV